MSAARLRRRPVPNGSDAHRTRSWQRGTPPAAAPRRPVLRARRPASEHAAPGTVLRSRDVELAFLGLDPAAHHGHPAAVPHHRHERRPEAAATTVIVPAERGPHRAVPDACPTSAPSTPSPSRCFPSYALRRGAQGASARWPQFEFLLIAAAARRGLGGVGARPRGHRRHLGRPLRARLPGARRLARRPELRARSACPPTAPIGLWGYSGGGLATAWAAEMCGDYAPELNIVGAVLGSPGRRPRPHLPPAQRHLSTPGCRRSWWPRSPHVYPDLDRVIAAARHRRGQGAAATGSAR